MSGFRRNLTLLVLLGLLAAWPVAAGQLELNGIGVYQQARTDLYLGALFLGWRADDPASIIEMPGRKHLDLRVSAERWPRAQVSKQWNQLITVNNSTAVINDSALDIMAFFAAIRGDLVKGDQMIIDLDSNNTTRIFLNGVSLLHTEGPGLFQVLFNSWLGGRPPSPEFKSGLLQINNDDDGGKLIARFNALKPTAARTREIARWRSGDAEEIAAATEPAPVAPLNAAPAAASIESVPASPAVSPKPAAAAATVAPVARAPAALAAAPATAPAPVQALRSPPPPRASPVAASAAATAVAAPVKPLPAKPAAKKFPVPEQKVALTAPSMPPATDLVASESAAARQKQLQNDYSRLVGKLIRENIAYPKRAIKSDIEGLVLVRMTLDRGGNIAALAIAESGEPILDNAAERGARKGAPYPAPSAELIGESVEVAIPVVFKLEQ